MARATEDSKQVGFTDREVDDPASQLLKVATKRKGQTKKKSTEAAHFSRII